VSIEIKCPLKEKQAASPENITIRTAGRIPDPDGFYNRMRGWSEGGGTTPISSMRKIPTTV
jgi:hypothetical protein